MKRRIFLASVILAIVVGCERPLPQSPALPPPRCKMKVLAFTASWCVPCQKAKPVLAQVEAAGVEVQVVDIDAQSELARQYGVTSVPTFIVFLCGKSVRTQDVANVLKMARRGC